MSNTLHLTLKKKRFDMILSGEKKEEYREVKEYWESRLYTYYPATGFICDSYSYSSPSAYLQKDFDTITFKNGYAKCCPEITIEYKGVCIGEGNPELGAAPGVKYFVLSLGKIISTKNIKP